MTPITPSIYWNVMGRMLKVWRSKKLSDGHICKLLRLWLGYEFLDLMDASARISSADFNEVRRRLGFESFQKMMSAIRRSEAFYVFGTNDVASSMTSPLWHVYDVSDGPLLAGSVVLQKSQDSDQDSDGIYNNNLNNNTTVGNPDGFSAEPDGVADTIRKERDAVVRRRIVRDYFAWVERQTDTDHRALWDDMMHRVRYMTDRQGRRIDDMTLTPDEALMVMRLLIDAQLVPYFMKREDFFRPEYMKDPARRVWWMKNFVGRYMKGMVVTARRSWQRRRRQIEAETAERVLMAQRQYRPLSAFEWQDPEGNRWYDDALTGRQLSIPADADPRPSDTSTFNYICNQWREKKISDDTAGR